MDRLVASDAEAMSEVGRMLASKLPASSLIYLYGDLGAGKTHLVRAMSEALGADASEVSSPTFALVHEYHRAESTPLIHLDCYRLSESAHEWEEIGIPEILRGKSIVFVEWPKAGFDRYALPDMRVTIVIEEDQSRTVMISDERRT